jgi:hypothetical protein
MFQKCLRLLANRDAIPAAVEKLHREERLEPSDTPGDGRMIKLEPFSRSLNASLPGNLQEDA